MTKGEIAKQLFLTGLNCSESVVLAFKDELNIKEEDLKKISIGFGGGLARQRLTCGAVSGMAMVLGALKSDGENKTHIYSIIQKACEEVKLKIGSVICGDLLEGVSHTEGCKPEERTAEYYKKRPCAEICEIVADITQKFLEE